MTSNSLPHENTWAGLYKSVVTAYVLWSMRLVDLKTGG